jgi:hypothetical protein
MSPASPFEQTKWDIANCITVIKITKIVESAPRGAAFRLEHIHNPALLFRCLARGALR